MANLMKMKRSSVPGKVPTTADLDLGEIAINTYDGKVYMKKNVSGVETIVLLTGAGSGDVSGPSSSANNAIVRFDGTSGKNVKNSSATVDDSGNLTSLTQQATGTGANTMPVGTTAQRPSVPTAGMYRMNSTTGEPEWFNATSSSWVKFADTANYGVEYLIVAGGGGGGAASGSLRGGGGGGAGGRIASSTTVNSGQSISVTVGAGGAFQDSTSGNGNNGSNSTLGSIGTAIGGGGGGGAGNSGGSSGGSGGGGGDSSSSLPGGAGTSGQGFAGGASAGSGSNGGDGASGGGAGGAGSSSRGSPGPGSTWVDGVTYARGGTGGYRANGSASGPSGAANTGNAGGGGDGSSGGGGAGGSGVVIIRYLGSQRGTGGTVSSSGGYTYHTFTSSGTFVA